MAISLYPDQIEFIDKLRAELAAGSKSVLGVASTGFGKTIVSAYIAHQAAKKGKRVWFVCHRKNLLTQTSKAFWQMKIEHGLIAGGRGMTTRANVQIATIQTLGNRLGRLPPPDLLVVDECHLAMAPTWLKVIDHCKQNGAVVIGNSATPIRLDGKGLDYIFDSMVEARSMQWLIANKRLSAYRIYAPLTRPDMSTVKIVRGDYSTEQVEAIMDKPSLTGDAVQHYRKYAKGLRAICYCASIKHSKHVAESFNAAGIPAIHIDGESTSEEIKDAVNGFADGRYQVLSNVELMTTGFDLSAQVNRDVPIEACILLRPTQSVSLYLQMVGRALRMKPNPAVILDHAGCCHRHGLPDDDREWSLQGDPNRGKRKKADPDETKIKQCEKCYAIFKPGPTECPSCGEPVQGKPRVIEVHEGHLEQLDIESIRRTQRKEQGGARTLKDLVEIGKRRGLKDPAGWAAHVYAARTGVKPDFNEARGYL